MPAGIIHHHGYNSTAEGIPVAVACVCVCAVATPVAVGLHRNPAHGKNVASWPAFYTAVEPIVRSMYHNQDQTVLLTDDVSGGIAPPACGTDMVVFAYDRYFLSQRSWVCNAFLSLPPPLSLLLSRWVPLSLSLGLSVVTAWSRGPPSLLSMSVCVCVSLFLARSNAR